MATGVAKARLRAKCAQLAAIFLSFNKGRGPRRVLGGRNAMGLVGVALKFPKLSDSEPSFLQKEVALSPALAGKHACSCSRQSVNLRIYMA